MVKSVAIQIIIDRATTYPSIPEDHELQKWAMAVLTSYCESAVLTIRIVDTTESAHLNKQYRDKTGPTNILSFCFETPPGMKSDILGDIVLCPALIEQEVMVTPGDSQHIKTHWAHLVVHGCFHLLGYDHDNDVAAHEMEQLEIKHLAELGYPNPYK